MFVSECDKFKLLFTRNRVIGCIRLKDLVTMVPYNSPKTDIPKDQVGSRGTFTLIINAKHDDQYQCH